MQRCSPGVTHPTSWPAVTHSDRTQVRIVFSTSPAIQWWWAASSTEGSNSDHLQIWSARFWAFALLLAISAQPVHSVSREECWGAFERGWVHINRGSRDAERLVWPWVSVLIVSEELSKTTLFRSGDYCFYPRRSNTRERKWAFALPNIPLSPFTAWCTSCKERSTSSPHPAHRSQSSAPFCAALIWNQSTPSEQLMY